MWPLRRRAPDEYDYAPSRMAYRANRFWLSPTARFLCLWVLPFALLAGWGTHWLMQPSTGDQIRHWRTQALSHLREQEDFQVRHLTIQGASPELAREIRRTLPVTLPVSVLDLPLDEVKAMVEDFDAVEHVSTHVMLGGALVITVTQRTPLVVWRTPVGLTLLDRTGHPVAVTDKRAGAADLPLVVADGADRAVPEALALYAAAEPISDRVRGLRRMGERRWDLVLTRGMVIQLPEENAVEQLQRVIGMHEVGELLDRDITHVDMRNPDRPTIRLGDQAMGRLRTLRAFQQGQYQQ